jgi:DNA-binding transcriptional ArsR family regulator
MTTSGSIQPKIVSEKEDFPDVDFYNIKKAARVLRALNHQLRQQIIRTIHENKRIPVTQIYVQLRLEQSVVSQHLAILRSAGIVSVERSGKSRYYSINYSRIADINEFVKNLLR